MANELDKLMAMDSASTELIKVKDQKIETLILIQGIKAEQMHELRIKNEACNKQVSQLKRQIMFYKIISLTAAALGLLAAF